MHIFFSIQDIKVKEIQTSISEFTVIQLQDEIGLAHFKITHYNKDILEFDNMLISTVLDLIAGYKRVKSFKKSFGGIFRMDADWDWVTHIKFTFNDGKFYLVFENGKKILMSESDFLFFLRSFSTSVFSELEMCYPRINENVHYCELKTKAKVDLGI